MPDEQPDMVPNENEQSLPPSRVQLEKEDALQLKVARLEVELAGERMDKARAAFALATRAQVNTAIEIGEKYGIDASKYEYDDKQNCLMLRQVRQLRQVGD